MVVGGKHHDRAALFPGQACYQLCRNLGGPQGRSGRVWKISLLPGFNPRTVGSSCTDWAIPAPLQELHVHVI